MSTSLETAKDLIRQGRMAEAFEAAWAAYDAAPDGAKEKTTVARLLRFEPQGATAERASAVLALLTDRTMDPGWISDAGWMHLLRDTDVLSGEPAQCAAKLEASPLALALLRENVVESKAEASLSAARRWLLLSGRWDEFPRLRDAFLAQAAINGGAWWFDAEERARLADAQGFARAYLPQRPQPVGRPAFADPVTRAVAEQYESWPYPVWTRPNAGAPSSLADDLRERDPDGPDVIPTPADVLIAGCGAGKQVTALALRWPQERFTAIDISETSVALARQHCAELGLTGVTFHVMDLHEIGRLGQTFDAVSTTGVLHHLPDPEAGWAALAAVVRPGGAMHVMVYSTLARLRVRAWRKALGALVEGPMSDDRLREIRHRILTGGQNPKGADFQSLAGVHDLLAHRHEDPFDVPRIRRALDRLGLELIGFDLPSPVYRARYRADNPHDPLRRDFAAWQKLEFANPGLFSAMYDFWCRKPL